MAYRLLSETQRPCGEMTDTTGNGILNNQLLHKVQQLEKEILGLYEKINHLEEIIYQMQCDLNDITEK